MISLLKRVMSDMLSRLYLARELIVVILSIGMGASFAFGLGSTLKNLAITIAGVSVYFLLIVIDPLKGLLLWLTTQPLLERYFNISLGAGIPDLSLTRLCIALLTVLLLARTAIRQQRLQSVNQFDVISLLLMVGMLQCGFRGYRGVSSIQGIFDLYWVPVLTCFAVKNLVTRRESVHLVLYAVLSVALYSAIYAIYETTTGRVLFTSGIYQGNTFSYFDSGLHILRGIWSSNEDFGRVLVMGIPINFYFYLRAKSLVSKVIWITSLALVFVGLFLTYKRIAWLAAVTVVFVMQSFYPQFRRLFIVLLIVVVIAGALNWDRISGSDVYTKRVNSQASTIEGRTDGWGHAIEFWSTSPLLGHGFRQYENLARAAGYRDVDVESEYLDILVSAGLAGFLPYIGLLLLMGYDGLRHYRGQVPDSLADRDLIAIFWGILAGYAITISTAIITNLLVPTLLFAVAGAIVYARCEAAVMQSGMRRGSTDTGLSAP